jgi:hypothetical protein
MANPLLLQQMPLDFMKHELSEFRFTVRERENPAVERLHRSRKDFHWVARLLPFITKDYVWEKKVTMEDIPEKGYEPDPEKGRN